MQLSINDACLLFETGFLLPHTHCIVKDDLKLLIILCLPPKCQIYKRAPSPAYKIFLIDVPVVVFLGGGILVTLNEEFTLKSLGEL